MLLAISGSKLFVLYLAVLAVIVFFFLRRFMKKNSNAKRNREDRYNELSTFILQYEASKKVEADKEKSEEQTKDNENESKTKEDKTKEESHSGAELDTETIARIKALYFDAEMPIKKISEKTGVLVEEIEKVIK